MNNINMLCMSKGDQTLLVPFSVLTAVLQLVKIAVAVRGVKWYDRGDEN